MNLIEDIVSQGHGSLDADYICIHETSNPGATAKNHRDYWSRDDTYAVHYVGDWTGDVYHCVPDDRLCWQVGNGNAHVIGIELCHAENQADFDKVWAVGVEWAHTMLAAHGWDTSHLINHDIARQWWGGTDHMDPIGYFAEYGKSWDDFINDVENGVDMTNDEWMQGWEAHYDGQPAPFYQIVNLIQTSIAKCDALAAAVDALAKNQGTDPGAIAGIVQDAVTKRLADIQFTISDKSQN